MVILRADVNLYHRKLMSRFSTLNNQLSPLTPTLKKGVLCGCSRISTQGQMGINIC